MKRTDTAGPLVWAGILASTCLLLYLTQEVLWLVVPCLLAIVLYYFTLPLLNRLVHWGLARERAVVAVMGLLLVILGLFILALLPWISQQQTGFENNVGRYTTGGINLIEKTIGNAQHKAPFLQRLTSHFDANHINDWAADNAEHYAGDVLLQMLHWLPSLLLVPYLTYFILLDGGKFKRFIVRGIPNAYFEKTLLLFHNVEHQLKHYLQGMLALTFLDAACLAIGLYLLGIKSAFVLALVASVMSWVPYIGSILGCLLVLLVAATDYPDTAWVAYGALLLFLGVRLLDDFVFLPLTVGRSLEVHPVVTVIMIFLGGAVAGIGGLLLVLPLLGVMMVFGQILGSVLTDERVRARHAHAVRLRKQRAQTDLF